MSNVGNIDEQLELMRDLKEEELDREIENKITKLVQNTIKMNEAIYKISELTEELFDLYLNRETNSHEEIKKLREIEKIAPQLDKLIETLLCIVVDLDRIKKCENYEK